MTSFTDTLSSIGFNRPDTTGLLASGEHDHIQNLTNKEWETLGCHISHNTHLKTVALTDGALNNQKISFLFRRLTRNSSIGYLGLSNNELSAVGVWSIVPFLQNANKLLSLDMDGNNLQSEGLSMLLYALCNSSIEYLHCSGCGIKSIDIDKDFFPKHILKLDLMKNNINADGCHRLATLLQREGCSLKYLNLSQNEIDNDGVEILANAIQSNASLLSLNLCNNEIKDAGVAGLATSLQNNTTLKDLDVANNYVSDQGKIILLKLVIDVSSIKATLQSNHTLKNLVVDRKDADEDDDENEDENEITIQELIDDAVEINSGVYVPEDAGKEKIYQLQLHRTKRAWLANLQGVKHSVYSEIDNLYLPEILSLINSYHGQKELFPALKSTMIGLLSIVDMRMCIQNHHRKEQDDKIVIPLDHTPTWQHILPTDYFTRRKEHRSRRRFVLSLINLWEFTLTKESVNIYGQSSGEVFHELREAIMEIAKDHIGMDGRKGAIFERVASGEGIMPDDLSMKQATMVGLSEDGNANVEAGKWRIPLGAYQALFSYLTREGSVEGIPPEQLRAATLGRERADKKQYPSVKSLLDRGGTRKRKAESLFEDLLDANNLEIKAEIDELVHEEEEMLIVKGENENCDPDIAEGRETSSQSNTDNFSTVSDSLSISAAMQRIHDRITHTIESSVQWVAENISFRDIQYPACKPFGLVFVSFAGRVLIKDYTDQHSNSKRPQIGAILVAANEVLIPKNAIFQKVLDYLRKLMMSGPVTLVYAEDKEFAPWFKEVVIPRYQAQLRARAEAEAQAKTHSAFHSYQCNKVQTSYNIVKKNSKVTCVRCESAVGNKMCSSKMCKKCCLQHEVPCAQHKRK